MVGIREYVMQDLKKTDKEISDAYNADGVASLELFASITEKDVETVKLSIAEEAVRAPLQNLLNIRFERVVNGIVNGTVRNEADIISVFSE